MSIGESLLTRCLAVLQQSACTHDRQPSVMEHIHLRNSKGLVNPNVKLEERKFRFTFVSSRRAIHFYSAASTHIQICILCNQ